MDNKSGGISPNQHDEQECTQSQKRAWIPLVVSELGFEQTSNTFSGTNIDGGTMVKPGVS